ncbi:transaldolase family protein [Dictyobacter arantiisoli]|uniref:Fructose-6-phosphate aldolase n=1 Tax=Dictyobacter arantiisoli TaxID=2014874 RepID=A0A5A5TKF5_9CHLR|nr:transaldolase family protein [Dictyobacter arantiisoli]GCF11745.1 fructose-6-phosphate aldolase [Dictyobacter arantiisoli]
MALYIDSAYLDDITATAQTIPLAGITTNPSLLLDAQQRGQQLTPSQVLTQLLERVSGTIFMQPSLASEEEAYQQTIAFLGADPTRVIPKIPMTQAGMRLAQRLKREGYHIAFTAVTTVSQAYAAAMVGADYIIPYYNRLRRSGVDPSERIAQMARALTNHPTRILAASIKSSAEADAALLSGAHDLTVPPACLLNMVTDPETESALTRFEQDWKKMKIS